MLLNAYVQMSVIEGQGITRNIYVTRNEWYIDLFRKPRSHKVYSLIFEGRATGRLQAKHTDFILIWSMNLAPFTHNTLYLWLHISATAAITAAVAVAATAAATVAVGSAGLVPPVLLSLR